VFLYLLKTPRGASFRKRVLCKAMPKKLNKPRILGVLAGGDMPLEHVATWVDSADIIVAADGAANTLYSCGVIPHTTVGDLDSIASSTKDHQVELIHIEDQDTSDCDKLLTFAADRGYTDLTLLCSEGDLLDHVLGNLYSAARSNLKIRLALRRGIAHILRGPTHTEFETPRDTRLSLLPLTPCTGVTISGAKWPLKNATLSPLGQISLSNQASEKVEVQIDTGAAVLFLSHQDLETPTWD